MGSWRSLIAFTVLFAFSIQNFLVQTHLHALPQSLAAAVGISVSAPPANDPVDADKCYLCQEFVHSGAYLTPAAVAVLPPSAVVSLLPPALVAAQTQRLTSHNWMGRAPPRA